MMRLIKKMSCSSIHIGGGEPMLKPDNLSKILETANRECIRVEYVETNSSWFTDLNSAKDTLAKLKNSGLKTLLISISPFHNEFIPFYKVMGVMEACRITGINIFPWITDFIQDLSVFDNRTSHTLKEYEEKFGDHYLSETLQKYWIHPGGRAIDLLRKVYKKKYFDQIMDENPGGCIQELTGTAHFHVDLYGNYIPGLCSGLSISFADLDQPLECDHYPIITTLAEYGIRGLYQKAQKLFNYSPIRSSYVNKCEMCTEIRGFFLKNRYGGSGELGPKGFYL